MLVLTRRKKREKKKKKKKVLIDLIDFIELSTNYYEKINKYNKIYLLVIIAFFACASFCLSVCLSHLFTINQSA